MTTASRLLCVLALGATTAGAQQAVPGRLVGSWLLNSYLSDSPAHIAQAIRYDTEADGDEFSGRGRGSDPKSPSPARTAPEERKDPLAPDDRKRLTELTDTIQFASPMLKISQTDHDLTVITATKGPTTLRPNGKAEEHALEAGIIKRTATWEGPALVITYDLDRGGFLRSRYVVVPATDQLLIRVSYQRPSGEAAPFEMKLVYDRQTEP